MPTFEVEFEVFCACGEGLCQQSVGDSGRYGPRVTVELCEKCKEKIRDEGYDEGYNKGYDDGVRETE